MKRVLITGSNGSCARFLLEALSGFDVYGLSRPTCDLLDAEKVEERIAEVRPEVVYHLASEADVGGSWKNPRGCLENNVVGTVNLLEAIRRVGIKPVVQICSTSEVYGDPIHWPIGETWGLEPVNPYAVSKVCQDLLGGVYSRAYGIPVVRTRAFGYVNPLRRSLSLTSFAYQIAEIECGVRGVLEHGNLESRRTFCDVRDVVDAYVLATNLEGVYNIGSEEVVSVGQCLEEMVSMSRVPVKKVFKAEIKRPVDVKVQVPDTRKFREATGWSQKYSLSESLGWLLGCAREHVSLRVAS